MARKLSVEQQKKATLASLKSPRTPKPLKEGLRKYARKRKWIP